MFVDTIELLTTLGIGIRARFHDNEDKNEVELKRQIYGCEKETFGTDEKIILSKYIHDILRLREKERHWKEKLQPC